MVLRESTFFRVFIGLLLLTLAACTGGGGGGTTTVDPPSNLIANVASPTQVQLSWTAPVGNVTGYALERRQGDGSFAPVGGSISASSVNFTDTVPQGGRSYTYRIKALNGTASSSSVDSNKVSVPSVCANGSSDIPTRGCYGPVVDNWPLVPTFSALLPNGKVIAWYASDDVGIYREDSSPAVHNQNPRTTSGLGAQDKSLVTLWNPSDSSFATANIDQSEGKGTDLFCAGYTVLNDGRFLTAGGNIGATWGSIKLNIFSPATNTWEKGPGLNTPNMWRDRWYPTLTKLPDGRVLISGGTSAKDASFTDGSNPKETALGDSSRTGQNICRTASGNCPAGLQGTAGGIAPAGAANLPPGGAGSVFATFRGIRGDGANTGYNNALEIYNPVNGSLSMLPTTAREIPTFEHYYPQFHVAPNGQVYLAGAGRQRAFLNQNFSGATPSAAWTDVQLSGGQRVYGSSVMYQPGRILVTGGGYAFGNNGNSSPVGGYGQTADNHIPYLITLNASSASIASGSGPNGVMSFRRTHHNSTVMADGRVFINGGQQNGGEGAPGVAPAAGLAWPRTVNEDTIWNLDLAVKTSEIWNPSTQTFGLAARADQERMYHSVAMLLPDATVLTAGGGGCGACNNLPDAVFGNTPTNLRTQRMNKKNSEVFYPPYLFKADGSLQERPVILSTTIPTADSFATIGYNASFDLAFAHPEAGRSISKVSLVALGTPTHAFNQNQRYLEPNFTTNGSTLTVSTTFTGAAKFGGATASQNAAPPGFYMLFILDDQGVPSEAKIIRIQ